MNRGYEGGTDRQWQWEESLLFEFLFTNDGVQADAARRAQRAICNM